MKFQNVDISQLNKHYEKKRPLSLRIVDVILGIYILVLLIYTVFCTIFIQVEIVGHSMQPTFNQSLPALEDAETSKYKDIAFANRFEKGTNGDIVIINTKEDGAVIKRIIAIGGQELTLRYESDGFYYFYVKDKNQSKGEKLIEEYILNRADMNQEYWQRFRDNNYDLIISEISTKETTISIPEGKVFVLGDNRKVSNDSSYYGPVDSENILGKIAFSYAYDENIFVYLWKQLCLIF